MVMKDILNWTRGKQVLKFGGEWRRIRGRSKDWAISAGNYAFNNYGTALPTSLSSTGDSYASFLLGQTATGTMNLPFQSESTRPYWGFFMQDDYRITSRLTLNLGMRFEFTGAGHIGSSYLNSTDYSGIGPRIGFAWQPLKKTVVRGGYGLFYGTNELDIVTNGYRTVASFTTLDQGVTPAFLLQDGFPGSYSTSSTAVTLSPSMLNGQSVTARSSSASRMPRTQNWSLSIQRELTSSWVAELSYTANKATRLASPSMVNDNQLNPSYLALGSLLTQPVTSAAAVAAGIPLPWAGFTGTVAQALRPYPQYLTITEQSAKAGGSFFQSVVARARKRYSAGITFDAHYTYSKTLGTSDTAMDHFNRRLEWSLGNYDIPHALVIQYMVDLPFGTGRRWANGHGVLTTLASGWNINGIQRYQSGTPLTISTSNTLPIFTRTLRPNVISGVARSTNIGLGDFDANTSRLINADAFSVPAANTFGNANSTYGDVRNFRVFSEDFSAVKTTRIRERSEFEFTAQLINALNRHRFTNFTTTRSTGTFGQATGSSLGRIVTLGLKFRF